MRLTTFAALAVTAIGGALLLSGSIADAAAKKRQKQDFFYSSQNQRIVYSRPRSRVTVRRERSYLDPGPELSPGERNYREYATPYGYSAIDDILGPGKGWNRTPFNDPYDVPGTRSRGTFSF